MTCRACNLRHSLLSNSLLGSCTNRGMWLWAKHLTLFAPGLRESLKTEERPFWQALWVRRGPVGCSAECYNDICHCSMGRNGWTLKASQNVSYMPHGEDLLGPGRLNSSRNGLKRKVSHPFLSLQYAAIAAKCQMRKERSGTEKLDHQSEKLCLSIVSDIKPVEEFIVQEAATLAFSERNTPEGCGAG